MSQPNEITLRNSTGSAIGTIPLAYLMANLGHFHVRFNKRGNIKHCVRKERAELVPLSNNGKAFQQKLETGPVWALRGTVGSGRVTRGGPWETVTA